MEEIMTGQDVAQIFVCISLMLCAAWFGIAEYNDFKKRKKEEARDDWNSFEPVAELRQKEKEEDAKRKVQKEKANE